VEILTSRPPKWLSLAAVKDVLKRPSANRTKLIKKQRKLAFQYLKDFNGKRAAIAAGYSKKTAKVNGSQLLTILNIQKLSGTFPVTSFFAKIKERTKTAKGEINKG
jgi:hypothetical protein